MPLLMVGSNGVALPAGVVAYEKTLVTTDIVKKVWLEDDVTQFDFYDRVDIVTASVEAVTQLFQS